VTALATLGSLLAAALVLASVRRRSLAWAYAVAGSALAVVLLAITANVVGTVGFEVAVLAIAGGLRISSTLTSSRRRARNLRRRQERQLARAAAERRERVAA
jgi:hypothetical protein